MKLNKNYTAFIDARFTKAVEDEEGDLIIEGYANTVSKDRMGDVIPTSAWEEEGALANYKKNPVILHQHNHSKAIGRMVDYEVDSKGLRIKAKISKGAGDVYQLIKDEVLSTFSVGFGIKDAKYIPQEDTFYITQLELYEVSVVAVPCNQDSTFSISKSLGEGYSDFREELIKSTQQPEPQADNTKDINNMSTETNNVPSLDDITATINKSVADALAAKQAADEKAAAAKAEKAAAEKAAAENAKAAAREAAQDLVKELEDKITKNQSAFADALKSKEEQIAELQDEIKQVLASRTKNFSYNKVTEGMGSVEARKDANDAVLLSLVTQKGIFETKFGERLKAVNDSSSIEVSSDAYETVFSTDLLRDIQAELVIAPLFMDIAMTSANLTIPVNPDRKNATWVTAAQYGTDNSSGAEVTVALTEITLTTLKLAAKSYITDETSEDAIIPLLPIIRQHLVEAHANEIDRAFLVGTGTNQPKGLTVRAAEAQATGAADVAGGVETTTATFNGTVAITAKMILKARKKMKLYGLRLRDIALIVSTEAYYALIEDDEWANVNEVGSQSTKLTGQVGQIYGMPVIVSDHFADPAASAPFAVLVNKNNFVVPNQRSVTVKTDFDVEKDRRVIVATQRLNLESLIRDAGGKDKGVVSVTYAAV